MGLLRLKYVWDEIYSQRTREDGPYFWIADSSCEGGERQLIRIGMPQMQVLTTDYYRDFLKNNNLKTEDLIGMAEADRVNAFTSAEFTGEQTRVLREIFERFKDNPMVIRSSGRFEYKSDSGFSGRFESLFHPLSGGDDENFDLFVGMVKRVYASEWSDKAIEYRNERGIAHEDDWMGIVFNRACGKKFKYEDEYFRYYYKGEPTHFAPQVSGVLDWHRFKPRLEVMQNFGLNTTTMEGLCFEDLLGGAAVKRADGREYSSAHFPFQAVNLATGAIDEFSVGYFDNMGTLTSHERSWYSRRYDINCGLLFNLGLLSRQGEDGEKIIIDTLEYVFRRAEAALGEPQRMEFSIHEFDVAGAQSWIGPLVNPNQDWDGLSWWQMEDDTEFSLRFKFSIPMVYQFSNSQTRYRQLIAPVDTSRQGFVAGYAEGGDLMGHGEYVGDCYLLKSSNPRIPVCGKALRHMAEQSPNGFTVVMDLGVEGKWFDMGHLLDQVVNAQGGKHREDFKGGFPLKGVVLYPGNIRFSTTGHNMEVLVERDLLAFTSNQQEGVEQLLGEELGFTDNVSPHPYLDKEMVNFRVRKFTNPMRLAVNLKDERAILHSIE